MSYIWEDKNRGKSLFEMAMDGKCAIVESMSESIPLNGGDLDELNKAISERYGAETGKDYTIQASGNQPVLQCTPEIARQLKNDPNLKQYVSSSGNPEEEKSRAKASIGDIIKTLDIDDARKRELAIGLHCIAAGKWFDGSDCTPEQERVVNEVVSALRGGNPGKAKETLLKINAFTDKAGIHPDQENGQLFKKETEGKQVIGSVQMPAMFDTEPDDSMWNDMVVTAFGMPLINMSHPAVKKIIASDNPEEECPADLKSFKKAVYGDKRLQAVFGKGGLERVILGKLSNLLTLGIAAKTLDEGKRADRIIKELKEKGGHIAHRNLLLANYADIVDADPDDDSSVIKVKAYNRSKKSYLGELEIPASALAQFYSAVDPVKSAKIYVEMYGVDGSDVNLDTDDSRKAVAECTESCESKPLVEGPISALSHAIAGKSDPSKVTADGNGKFKELKEKYVKYLSENGHPPAYVLKPKSENKEVDVISSSETGRAQASGVVHMVSMKIGDHQAAAFMKPETIKKYFSA